MKSRLINEYTEIEKKHKTKVLNNEITIDKAWETSVFGVSMQIDLSQEIKDRLQKHLDTLYSWEGENLWFPPKKAQHITCDPVINWVPIAENNAEKIWIELKDVFLKKFKALDYTFPAFTINFQKFIATTGGIIWCATDADDEMEKLRAHLSQSLRDVIHSNKNLHIIHTTIARYKNKLYDPARVLHYLENQTQSYSMKVNTLLLRIEKIYPSLAYDEVAQINLNNE